MHITAHVRNAGSSHDAAVSTEGSSRTIPIPSKPGGAGSAVNGGELLMLALATCYCNDLYREAARLKITLKAVEVEAGADFDGIGLAARNIRYRARVDSPAPESRIAELLEQTDAVAEIHNTLRAGTIVVRDRWPGGD
jgi:organic hydroperoxide reductase OsmC/OhrA